jgi:hypothetical protein
MGIKMYPPGGGEESATVVLNEHIADQLRRIGWSDKKPTKKSGKSKSEVKENG